MGKLLAASIFGLMLFANYLLTRFKLWSEGKSYVRPYQRSNGAWVDAHGRNKRSLW